MKLLLRVALIGLVASVASLSFATPSEAGKKHDKRDDARCAFAPRDVVVIREYYAPRYQRLPPGLEKKLQRTGQLPPGWQSDLSRFPSRSSGNSSSCRAVISEESSTDTRSSSIRTRT